MTHVRHTFSATAYEKDENDMPAEEMNQIDVEALRTEVGAAIDSAVARLKAIEVEAQQRLRKASVEQQHLDSFLDELNYRLRVIAAASSRGEPPSTITGPLSPSQVDAMTTQGDTLKKRRAELEQVNASLDQLSSRLSWLVHQIDGACAWVLTDGEKDNTAGMQPDSGEQVMWAQIIMGQEAERARLAREIHDGPAQALANTVMRLQFVEQMNKQRPEEVEGELVRLRHALQESLKDVRRFIFNLRPASLSESGLIATLRHYAHDYTEQFEVPIELNLPENLVLSSNQELVVFRVIQEALQNIHKHANATRIEINAQQRRDGPLTVTISDNGQGFDPASVLRSRPSSSGVVSMRERAATTGGTLKVDSKAGAGTTVTLVLPMPKGQAIR
ncbi:MAG: sensor histidine kinase [Chloroflexi bacterium]|nr:sensor histidine kinase [Chloroflexota bacterium]